MKYFSTFSGIGGFERGILEAWESVNTAESETSSTEVINQNAKTASEGISLTGELRTRNHTRSTRELSGANYDKRCSICTETNVSAAVKSNQCSLHSNTETVTDTLTESNTAQAICTSSPSKNINQRNTKSSAITAITQKEGTESAPICVGYSEIDKYARSVYEYHFPNTLNFGDITKINAEELPDFDCLVGGFPCQAFSIAGKRKGFQDTRGTLFFDLARILRAKTPRLFVFENVKGLLSHDNGNTFKTIVATIDELGYDCQWQVLNSKNHGVPQNRERIYIVGHLRGTPRPEVFPFTGADGKDIRQINGNVHQDYRVYATNGIAPALAANRGGGAASHPFVKVPQATTKGYIEATVGQAINLSVPNSKTRRGRVSDIAPTLDTGMQLHTLTEDIQIRRLTPIECERLQGFPDNWTAHSTNGAVSDTQRYKMCGNAVTVNVVEAVFGRILHGESI